MNISFSKYHGAGNDFILIDDTDETFPAENNKLIRDLCCRRFGVGADGLMLLRPSGHRDFSMVYFNADGFEGSMCGNGGRCLAAFARDTGRFEKKDEYKFIAVDGEHSARFLDNDIVCLKMKTVEGVQKKGEGYSVDTGSLHHVEYVDNIVDMDVLRRGSAIRRHQMYSPGGCNVNFIKEERDGSLSIRTYEKGVEDETLACGTGSVAAAIVHFLAGNKKNEIVLHARGGELKVRFVHRGEERFEDIWLEGPAVRVFDGVIRI